MEKIILGIHGLANKPDKETLIRWWIRSIKEGLKETYQIENPEINLDLSYWADLLYKYPLHNDENYRFDALYNREPYLPAKPGEIKANKDSFIDDLRAGLFDTLESGFDFLNKHLPLEKLNTYFLGMFARDLDFYYHEEKTILNRFGHKQSTKKVLRDELKKCLLKHQDKEIMLISHSMGSIIAYDALYELSLEDPKFRIAHFVTMGSPLGFPYIKAQFMKEYGVEDLDDLKTPKCVTKTWTNFSDKRDRISLDTHIMDDFNANKYGVQVTDFIVLNDYTNLEKEKNPHKSYGYLRTPEVSYKIRNFLRI